MAFLFEKLDVYNESMAFADLITNLTDGFPRGKNYLSDQLNRAVTSIPFNIAEGNGKWSKKEKQSYFRISRGSAFECVSILALCHKKGLITENQHLEYRDTLDRICKMLTGLINKNA